MKISKYLISIKSSFFTNTYQLSDESQLHLGSIQINSLSNQIHSFQFLNDQYTIEKESPWSSIYHVYKNEIKIATIKNKSLWNSNLIITTPDSSYLLRSDLTYREIDIVEHDAVIGKISRKTKWFNTSFGIAINHDSNHLVFIISTILQHRQMKAQTAA